MADGTHLCASDAVPEKCLFRLIYVREAFENFQKHTPLCYVGFFCLFQTQRKDFR